MIKKLQGQITDFYSHHKTAAIIIIYTIIWFVLAGLILFIFDKNGKVFLWTPDGVYQHFTSYF